jgi:hypothetical protein
MSLSISSYYLDQENDVAGTCTEACTDSNVMVGNISFTASNSIYDSDYKNFCAEDENGNIDLLLKGVEDQDLSTNEREISIGEDNISYVLSQVDSDPYQLEYVGGCLEFDVDVSQVGCACSAGIQLTPVNDQCTMSSVASFDSTCSTIDIMKANINGFEVGSDPCDESKANVFGNDFQCKVVASDASPIAYGNNQDHIINTQLPYHVTTDFAPKVDENGQQSGLATIKTKLH